MGASSGSAFLWCDNVPWHLGMQPPGPANLSWSVPRYVGAVEEASSSNSRGGGPVRAARAFEPGEVVERTLCIEWPVVAEPRRCPACFLEAYCCTCRPARSLHPPGSTGPSGLRLLPTGGWALLFGQHPSLANLVIEYEVGPAPSPPGAQGQPWRRASDKAVATVACHWLVLRAVRHISPGEPLFAPKKAPVVHTGMHPSQAVSTLLPPVFEAARTATCVDGMVLQEPDEDEEEYVFADAPEALSQLQAPAVCIGASAVQGVGVFARRDIRPGEVVDLAPMLPVAHKEIRHSPLRDYVYQSDFQASTDVVLLPLGLGGLYNHSHSGASAFGSRSSFE